MSTACSIVDVAGVKCDCEDRDFPQARTLGQIVSPRQLVRLQPAFGSSSARRGCTVKLTQPFRSAMPKTRQTCGDRWSIPAVVPKVSLDDEWLWPWPSVVSVSFMHAVHGWWCGLSRLTQRHGSESLAVCRALASTYLRERQVDSQSSKLQRGRLLVQEKD